MTDATKVKVERFFSIFSAQATAEEEKSTLRTLRYEGHCDRIMIIRFESEFS